MKPANITKQILNFGLPAPIDVQVVGRNEQQNFEIARRLEAKIKQIPGAVDVHIHQVMDVPELRVNVDRTRAGQLGLTQRDVSNSMLISLSSSGQTAPNQWLNPTTGVNYNVAVQTPQYRFNKIEDVLRTPIAAVNNAVVSSTNDSLAGTSNANQASTGTAANRTSLGFGNPGAEAGKTQLLSNLATVQRGQTAQIVNHYNVQPVFDVYTNIDRRDLGSVSREIEKIVNSVLGEAAQRNEYCYPRSG